MVDSSALFHDFFCVYVGLGMGKDVSKDAQDYLFGMLMCLCVFSMSV